MLRIFSFAWWVPFVPATQSGCFSGSGRAFFPMSIAARQAKLARIAARFA